MAEEIINQPGEGEKTFTQAEVDALIGKRLGEERKKYPTAEEMTAFNSWKAAQQTETEKLAGIVAARDTAQTERDAARAEVQQLKNERYLLAKGVAADDLDYFSFKINKEVSENKSFEAAADEFLKGREDTKARFDTGANVGGGTNQKNPHAAFNDQLRRSPKH